MLGPKGMYRGSTARDVSVKRILNGEVQYEGTIKTRDPVKTGDADILKQATPGTQVLPFYVGGVLHSLYYTPWHYFSLYPIQADTIPPAVTGANVNPYVLEEELQGAIASYERLYTESLAQYTDVLWRGLSCPLRRAAAIDSIRNFADIRVDMRRSTLHHNVFSIYRGRTDLVTDGRSFLIRSVEPEEELYSIEFLNGFARTAGGSVLRSMANRWNQSYRYYRPTTVRTERPLFPALDSEGNPIFPPSNVEYASQQLDDFSTLIYDTKGTVDPLVILFNTEDYSIYYLEETPYRYVPALQRLLPGRTGDARAGFVPRIPAASIKVTAPIAPDFTVERARAAADYADNSQRIRTFDNSLLKDRGILEYSLPDSGDQEGEGEGARGAEEDRDRVSVFASKAALDNSVTERGLRRSFYIENYTIEQNATSSSLRLRLSSANPSVHERFGFFRINPIGTLPSYMEYDSNLSLLRVGNRGSFGVDDVMFTAQTESGLRTTFRVKVVRSEDRMDNHQLVYRDIIIEDLNNVNLDLSRYMYLWRGGQDFPSTYSIPANNTVSSGEVVDFGLRPLGWVINGTVVNTQTPLTSVAAITARFEEFAAATFGLQLFITVMVPEIAGLYPAVSISRRVPVTFANDESVAPEIELNRIFPVITKIPKTGGGFERRHALAVANAEDTSQVVLAEGTLGFGQPNNEDGRAAADPSGEAPATDSVAKELHTFGNIIYDKFTNESAGDKDRLNFWSKLVDDRIGLPTHFTASQLRLLWFARDRYGLSDTTSAFSPFVFDYFEAAPDAEARDTQSISSYLPYSEESQGAEWVRLYEGNVLVGLREEILFLEFPRPFNLANFIPKVFSRFGSGGIPPVRKRNFLFKVDNTRQNIERLETQFQYQSQYAAVTVSNKIATDYLAGEKVVQMVGHPTRYGIYVVTDSGRLLYGYIYSDGTVGWSELKLPMFTAESRIKVARDTAYYTTPQGNLYVAIDEGTSMEVGERRMDVELLPVALFLGGDRVEVYLDLLGRTLRSSLIVDIQGATKNEDNYVYLGVGEDRVSRLTYSGAELQEHTSDEGDGVKGLLISYDGDADFTLLRVARSVSSADPSSFGDVERAKRGGEHPLLPALENLGRGFRGRG